MLEKLKAFLPIVILVVILVSTLRLTSQNLTDQGYLGNQSKPSLWKGVLISLGLAKKVNKVETRPFEYVVPGKLKAQEVPPPQEVSATPQPPASVQTQLQEPLQPPPPPPLPVTPQSLGARSEKETILGTIKNFFERVFQSIAGNSQSKQPPVVPELPPPPPPLPEL